MVSKDTGMPLPDEALPPKVPLHILEVIEFFDTVSTQWNVGFSGITSLNYASVEMMSKVYDFELTEWRMDVIREIEAFYLEKERE